MNPTAFATAFRHWGDTREGLHLDGVLIALPLRTERRQQRSEEHTSELQSQSNLVCRLLLEKKKNNNTHRVHNDNRPPCGATTQHTAKGSPRLSISVPSHPPRRSSSTQRHTCARTAAPFACD